MLLCLALGIIILLSISLGSVYIPISEIFHIMLGKEAANPAWNRIIFDYRLPKSLTALIAGAALSLSGLQMQTLFRNPLAGPYVLGISAGASLGVAILILAGISLSFVAGLFSTAAAAITGASLVLILIMSIARRVRDNVSLLIIGLMIGSTTGAVLSVLQYFSQAERIQSFIIWAMGSLGSLGWQEIPLMLAFLFIGFGIAIYKSRDLNALLLGENYAKSLGISIERSRLWIILSAGILAGVVTAFCGPIAFIGLAAPHLARILFDTSDHKILIPSSALIGALVLLCCDVVAQLPGSAKVLPINVMTSLIGAPIVIWLVVNSRNLKVRL
ncbi:MAG TPA: iron ABC transporter permease [Cyclobacteriaceae bacterium]|nr:iron ABC transporter permease [Cyclobacteriaceae bacterium]